MAISILFNGVVYSIPETGEESWGENLTSFFSAIPQGALQKTGGAFTLTADTNFGANYGLLSKYFSTRTSLPSTAGILRLAVSDTIGWRNNANGANLLLAVNGSDQLTYNGTAIYPAGITALAGEVTATGPGSAAATVSNAAVIAKVLTGYTSGAGTVSASDSILAAIQKLNGNLSLIATTQTANTIFAGPLSGSAATPAFRALASPDFSAFSASPTALINVGIASSTSAGALTVSIVQNDGSTAATASSPLLIGVLPTSGGAFRARSITSSLSLVISSGTTLGMVASQENNLWVYYFDSDGAGTHKVAVSTVKWSDKKLNVVVAESFSVTATNASPCVFTAVSSNLIAGIAVTLTGTPPTGFSLATKYYVVSISGNTFQLALVPGGTGINSSSTGSAVVAHIADGTLVSDVAATKPVRLIGRIGFVLATPGTWITAVRTSLIFTERDPDAIGAAASTLSGQATNGVPIVWTTLIYDTIGAYNLSTGRYVCQSKGLYCVTVTLLWTGGATYLSVYKNGVEYSRILSAAAAVTGSSGSVQMLLNLYDIIDIRPDITTTGATTSSAITANWAINKVASVIY